jgi:hypothetical protein
LAKKRVVKYSIGERVKFLDEQGEGVIKSFKGKIMAMVEIDEGFEIPVPVNQLVKIYGEIKPDEDEKVNKSLPDIKGVKKVILEKDFQDKNTRPSKRHKGRNNFVMEVDLHIEKLLDDYRGLSNGEIVTIQLNEFKRKLDSAIRNKADKIVFIHGVGNGVLKNEIRSLLNGYEKIEFYDASFAKYGFGATEVIIK